MRRVLLLVGAILVLAFLVFLPTIRYALVYDDLLLLVPNQRLTSWSYLPGYFTTHLWAHQPLEHPNYYRPISLIWFRLLDATLGAPGPIWHLGSILAHLAVTVFVLLLIRRLTGDWKGALLAAGLFAIHPVHTETVAWVSCGFDLLVTAFLVLCVYYYAGKKSPISFVSLLFAALAMFTKETGIVAPALILTYEWTQSNIKQAITAAAPYLMPALLFAALRMNALGNLSTGVPPNMTVSTMVLTWPRVLAAYAAHLIWPVHLSVCYDVPMETAIWPLLVMIVVVAGLIWAARGCSANVRFGAAWFAITLLPALGIRYLRADDYVHDRYLYLPTVGLALITAEWFSRLRLTPARIVAVCSVAMACCWGTTADLQIWRNETSLFRRAVETAPQNPSAKNNLAIAYLDSGRPEEALPLVQQFIASRPGDYRGYVNMVRYYRQTGNQAEADRYYAIFRQIYQSEQAGHGR